MSHPRSQPMNRREALRWILGLSAFGGIGLCGSGGLLTLLMLRRAAAERVFLTQTVPAATLAVPPTPVPPPIVARAAWGARAVNHEAADEKGFASATNPDGWLVYQGDLSAIYRTVAIHHSAPIHSSPGAMKEIQDLHMDTRKWADIGYHYGVAADGTIYEGRDIQVRGSNIAGYNTGTIGVVAIGDFRYDLPSQAQLTAILALALWLKALYKLTHIVGHSDFNPTTECPGPNLKPYLDTFAKAASLKHDTGGYVPPTGLPPAKATDAAELLIGSCC